MHELLKNVVLPPASLVIVALLGQTCRAWTKARLRVVTVCLVLLYMLSTPLISDTLMSTLEVFPALPSVGPLPSDAQAIVILGADVLVSPEFGTLSPGPLTLQRLRYGAQLQHRTGLPILVTGGAAPGATRSIGAVMRQSLDEDFHRPVSWTDETAADTRENALQASRLLRAAAISRIFLVTHAWHMRRAKLAFVRAGLTVIAAPTAFVTDGPGHRPVIVNGIQDLLPSPKAWHNSYFAFHELMGLVFYHVSIPLPASASSGILPTSVM